MAAESTEPPKSVWQHIWQDVLLLGTGSIVVVFAQLAFRSVLIAALAPATYGRLSLALGVYNTIWILGTSGLPNSVARFLAIRGAEADHAIVRAALQANAWLTAAAAVAVGISTGLLLDSVLAGVVGAIGVAGLIYSLLSMGILRGRGRLVASAAVMPITAFAELTPLLVLYFAGVHISPLAAFTVFSLGNVVGLGAGFWFARRSTPPRPAVEPADVPSPLRLLGFSVWLAAATAGLSVLPLIVRSVAAFDSYTVVAVVDVSLVLFNIPQRIGSVIVMAAIPRAARAIQSENADLTISLRTQAIAIVPFLAAAAVVAFTPALDWVFEAIGRPEYEKSIDYLALALLAGPARILYGLVEGALVAHGEGRFLALNVLSITAVAALAMLAAAALGSVAVAFAIFVATFWVIYLCGQRRVAQLAPRPRPAGAVPAEASAA
jgi:O-antigen/teichoic acid export membrane protein